jgi:lipopolysaccharide/colanic/teichoic acid biosynthesis glycosyltransferase
MQLAGKRATDFLVAIAGLTVLAPLMAAVAVAIRLSMGSPVLFRQQRPGLNESLFTVCKFRTMTDARDENGQPLPDWERMPRLGKALRDLSIDELPQLWNVVKGDMSLVGPRPLITDYLQHYNAFQRRRHEVKPGITGLAQVNGRNALTWEQKFELDVWYVDHWSLLMDVKILVRTVREVLNRTGITPPGPPTDFTFRGSGANRPQAVKTS